MNSSDGTGALGLAAEDERGGYESGYRASPCFWGREPASLLPPSLDLLPESLEGLRVLDAGCGEGKNSVFFARRGAEVHAFDVSPIAIQNAKGAWGAEGAEIQFEVGDVLSMQLPSQSYDVVILYGLLHCLASRDAMREAVMQLTDVTKRRGIHVVCALNSRLDGFAEGHPRFRPRLESHDFYVSLYKAWELSRLSDGDLTESHPPTHQMHTHAVTRFIARRT